jgi:hypothetical protein
VTPVTRTTSNVYYDDEEDEHGYPLIKNIDDVDDDDDDSVESVDEKHVGRVGMKWRTRILRVLDSEEQWKGVCEIYFHWYIDDRASVLGKGGIKKRKKDIISDKERRSIKNIDKPEKCPIFIILNEEESNSTEEMYYTMPGFPNMMFGYLAWTVVVHERLELEVSGIVCEYDRVRHELC